MCLIFDFSIVFFNLSDADLLRKVSIPVSAEIRLHIPWVLKYCSVSFLSEELFVETIEGVSITYFENVYYC